MQCVNIIDIIIYCQILSQKAVHAIPANNDSWGTSPERKKIESAHLRDKTLLRQIQGKICTFSTYVLNLSRDGLFEKPQYELKLDLVCLVVCLCSFEIFIDLW